MEVYFKDLISEDGSLDKLVEDVAGVVQGAAHFAATVSPALPEPTRAELNNRVARLKENYLRVKQQAVSGARATDKMVRQYPYWMVGAGLAAGVLIGATWARRK